MSNCIRITEKSCLVEDNRGDNRLSFLFVREMVYVGCMGYSLCEVGYPFGNYGP